MVITDTDKPDDPERFWLGIVGEDGYNPKTRKFVIDWLSTYKPGEPNFQNVCDSLHPKLSRIQIYVTFYYINSYFDLNLPVLHPDRYMRNVECAMKSPSVPSWRLA